MPSHPLQDPLLPATRTLFANESALVQLFGYDPERIETLPELIAAVLAAFFDVAPSHSFP